MTNTRTKPIQEQKCPACGAMLRFDPALGMGVCDYCGTQVPIEAGIESPSDGESNNSIEEQISHLRRDESLETMEPLPVYNCVSCGAEVIAPPQTGALTCPYCQNNIVLTEQFSGTLKPDGLIPFKITPDKLPGAIHSFYHDKPLLSRQFFTKNRIGKVTGIYVPFWLFDCRAEGLVNYTGETPGHTHREGNYLITQSQKYRLVRELQADFRNLAVDAGAKMDDALMDSVGPFDYNALVPFDVRYLAGYVADRFDQTSASVQKRNDQRVLNTLSELAGSSCTSGYLNIRPSKSGQTVTLSRARYVLLPIYLVNIEYNGHTYPYAVNGQTGRVVGQLPTELPVDMMYRLKYFAAGFGAMALAIYAMFVR